MARNAGQVKFSRPASTPYPDAMPRLPPPRRQPPKNLRNVNLLVRQIKRRPPYVSPRTILAENGRQLQTESGIYLQTEA